MTTEVQVNHRKRQKLPQWIKYLPGYALLLLCLGLSYRNALYFDTGTGGTDWKIGKPQITLWTASHAPALPQLRTFAIQLINRDRRINGLPPLVEDPLLSVAAQGHAADMQARNYYNHVTPEGKTPTDRFAAVGGNGGVGENIMLQSNGVGVMLSLNLRLIEEFQKSWMYSNGHRENLLNPQYTRVGYGIVTDPKTGKIYAVQNFQ